MSRNSSSEATYAGRPISRPSLPSGEGRSVPKGLVSGGDNVGSRSHNTKPSRKERRASRRERHGRGMKLLAGLAAVTVAGGLAAKHDEISTFAVGDTSPIKSNVELVDTTNTDPTRVVKLGSVVQYEIDVDRIVATPDAEGNIAVLMPDIEVIVSSEELIKAGIKNPAGEVITDPNAVTNWDYVSNVCSNPDARPEYKAALARDFQEIIDSIDTNTDLMNRRVNVGGLNIIPLGRFGKKAESAYTQDPYKKLPENISSLEQLSPSVPPQYNYDSLPLQATGNADLPDVYLFIEQPKDGGFEPTRLDCL